MCKAGVTGSEHKDMTNVKSLQKHDYSVNYLLIIAGVGAEPSPASPWAVFLQS